MVGHLHFFPRMRSADAQFMTELFHYRQESTIMRTLFDVTDWQHLPIKAKQLSEFGTTSLLVIGRYLLETWAAIRLMAIVFPQFCFL